MTSEQIGLVLTGFGISANTWASINTLSQIDLSRDGNIIVRETELYYFDTTSQLLYIKEYENIKVANGWQLKAVSDNFADIIIDFNVIVGVTAGIPLRAPTSTWATLYRGE